MKSQTDKKVCVQCVACLLITFNQQHLSVDSLFLFYVNLSIYRFFVFVFVFVVFCFVCVENGVAVRYFVRNRFFHTRIEFNEVSCTCTRHRHYRNINPNSGSLLNGCMYSKQSKNECHTHSKPNVAGSWHIIDFPTVDVIIVNIQ